MQEEQAPLALVVYESMFGNTSAVAKAVARGLAGKAGDEATVLVTTVDAAPPEVPPGTRLVVVGGPTHAFGMSRPSTREDAVRQGATGTSVRRGLREWVDVVEADPGVRFAVFDTRADRVRRLPGSAAHQASRHLRRRGFRLAAGPTSYYVSDVSGPLLDDELEKARRWGEALARTVLPTEVR